jgi:hypothetical protein
MHSTRPPLVPPQRLQHVAPLPPLNSDASRPSSSLATYILVRASSAAPVHQAVSLVDIAEKKKRSISTMCEKKNDEMLDRHEKILWMTRDAGDEEGRLGSEFQSIQSAFSQLTFSSFGMAPGDQLHRSEKKRVSLLSRVVKSEGRQESYIGSSLARLRRDGQQREQFFRQQQSVITDRHRQAHDSGTLHRTEYEAELRQRSPEQVLSRLQQRCSSRDSHIMDVQLKKRRLFLCRQSHREELVERTRSIGLALHDACETLRPPAELTLWWSVMVAWRAVQRLLHALRDGNARPGPSPSSPLAAESDAAFSQPQRRTIWTMKPSAAAAFVTRVQAWWRSVSVRRLVQRRRAAATVVSNYLLAVPKIPFQFRYLVKRMLRIVGVMQAHYRAVRLARMLRRNQGVALVNKRIRIAIATADEELSRLVKKKKQAEAQQSAAIKARKPLFEMEIRTAAARMTQLSRQKELLLALTDASKFSEVSRVVYNKETAYREELRQYGLGLFDRYMVSVNIKRVLEQRMEDYQGSLRRKSISSLTLPSLASIREESQLLQMPKKPCMCVGLQLADAQEMLGTTLLERADADLAAKLAQSYSRKPSNL